MPLKEQRNEEGMVHYKGKIAGQNAIVQVRLLVKWLAAEEAGAVNIM